MDSPYEWFHVASKMVKERCADINNQVHRAAHKLEDYVIDCIIWIVYALPPDKANSKICDMLVFLPGDKQIKQIETYLREYFYSTGYANCYTICTLSAKLTKEEKDYAIDRSQRINRRFEKIILSTNIAETSLTIDGISIVIDSLKVSEKSYEPSTTMNKLEIINTSKASAKQRAGRTGRTNEGWCLRACGSKDEFDKNYQDKTIAPIMRENLNHVILHILKLGYRNIKDFPFFDQPDSLAISNAITELYYLGYIDIHESSSSSSSSSTSYNIVDFTEAGKIMCLFPTNPIDSRILYESIVTGCFDSVVRIIVMTSTEKILEFLDGETMNNFRNPRVGAPMSDHLTLLNIHQKY
jgi:HrpA-like RNA helicase